jgi:hypothetical protein
MTILNHTVWVVDENEERGTAHVSFHEGSAEQAADAALIETASDWGRWNDNNEADVAGLRVLGIASGDVNIVEWND